MENIFALGRLEIMKLISGKYQQAKNYAVRLAMKME